VAETYYDILFISSKATTAEIKSAYRKLVLQYHPDRNDKSEQATKQFRKIRIAYETLINPEKKKAYDNTLSGKSNLNETITKRAFHAIKIIIDRRIVTIEDEIEVEAITPLNGRNLVIEGLEFFELKGAAEYSSANINGRRHLRVTYKLKPKKTGYLSIGPATIIVNRVKYESEKVFVKVKSPGETPVKRTFTRTENIFYTMIFSLFFCLLALVVYNINTRGLMPDEFLFDDKLQQKRKVEIFNQLQTGESPYEKYYGKNLMQSASENILRIINGDEYDAVVFVENTSGKTVRNHYIKAGARYEIDKLPDGKYFLKVMFGNDWNKEKNLNNNIKGTFNKDLHFLAFTDSAEALTLEHRASADSVKHSVYEIKLYPVDNGNVKGKKTNEKEFFQ
jgi:curved DNA-binding protein CbpA